VVVRLAKPNDSILKQVSGSLCVCVFLHTILGALGILRSSIQSYTAGKAPPAGYGNPGMLRIEHFALHLAHHFLVLHVTSSSNSDEENRKTADRLDIARCSVLSDVGTENTEVARL
jgi:hypothetical protein